MKKKIGLIAIMVVASIAFSAYAYVLASTGNEILLPDTIKAVVGAVFCWGFTIFFGVDIIRDK